MGNNVFDFDDIPLKPKTLYKYQSQEKVVFSFRKEVRLSLDNIWMPSETKSTKSVQSSHESHTERKIRKQLTPHTIFIAHQIQLGELMLNSWQYLKKLAAESRGSELIDLPGYGHIYLKQDSKDIKNTILCLIPHSTLQPTESLSKNPPSIEPGIVSKDKCKTRFRTLLRHF